MKEQGQFSKGIFRDKNSSVWGKDNQMTTSRGIYTFDKNINELFLLEELNYKSSYEFEKLVIDKKISFTKDDSGKKVKVEFKDNKILIDDVEVPKQRFNFFYDKADGNSQTIKDLKGLNFIKLDFIQRDKINVNGFEHDLELKVEYKDKLFGVEFLGNKIFSKWEDLGLFRRDNRNIIHNIDREELLRLAEFMGLTKKELFEYFPLAVVLVHTPKPDAPLSM